MTFGSGQMRSSKQEFGFAFRVHPIGYRYEDEREMLRAPLGWPLLSLLCSQDKVTVNHKAQSLISCSLNHARAPELIRSLMRYLR